MTKDSNVVVWNRNDYIAEEEKQLKDKNFYKDVEFNEKMLRACDSDTYFENIQTVLIFLK